MQPSELNGTIDNRVTIREVREIFADITEKDTATSLESLAFAVRKMRAEGYDVAFCDAEGVKPGLRLVVVMNREARRE